MVPSPHAAALLSATLFAAVAMSDGVGAASAAAGPACATATWLDPATSEPVAHDRVVARLAERPVVLLGERHTVAEDHRWQLHMLAALHARRPDMVIGLEMFPRSVQPALDAWVAGERSAHRFLVDSDWAHSWGYPSKFYMPLFHFARQHRVPMVAMNVGRDLVARVGREGWAAVPAAAREGVGDPAPASEDYRRALAGVFAVKAALGGSPAAEDEALPEPTEAEIAGALDDPAFARFVEAQLTWDRAMAEAIATARDRAEPPLVVGVLGRGHAEHRWGVPRQLADLGIDDAAVLLPVESCEALEADIADWVFVVERIAEPERPRPMLGVAIETADDGVRVLSVADDSVAEAAGIRAGDVVRRAAGIAVETSGTLIRIIRRQAPGTWLPLTVERDGDAVEIVARFPPAPVHP